MFKMKTLAAVIALAAAGSANAAYQLPNTGNGSLMLTAWDVTTQESYIRDLGYNYADFTTAMVTPEAGLVINFALDPLFSSLFGDNSASNVYWNVTAADSTASSGSITGTALMGTGAFGTLATAYSVTNTGIANTSNYMNTFFGYALTQPNDPGVDGNAAVGNEAGNCSTSSSCYSVDSGDLQFTGDANWGANWGSNLTSWINAGTLGSTLGFYSMTPNGTFSINQATKVAYGNVNGLASWLLAADGSLVYSVPGAVSTVPVPAAAWLFGSGLLGLVGVARRHNAQ